MITTLNEDSDNGELTLLTKLIKRKYAEKYIQL